MSSGVSVDVIYDIGCFKGTWTQSIMDIFPQSQYYLFDPIDHPKVLPKNKNFEFHQVLFAEEDAIFNFYSINSTGDSLYRDISQIDENVSAVALHARKLNSYSNQYKLRQPNFLKLDVQGAELRVLSGASNSLKNASLLLLEVPFYPFNVGAPQLGDYLAYTRDAGFLPVAIEPLRSIPDLGSEIKYRPDSFIVQADILFVKRAELIKIRDMA